MGFPKLHVIKLYLVSIHSLSVALLSVLSPEERKMQIMTYYLTYFNDMDILMDILVSLCKIIRFI